MIKILDRYIVSKFLVILFYTTMAFIAIFIVVDFVEHLDKFLSGNGTALNIALYYFYYIPYIIHLTLPVNMLLSSLFSLGTMAQYNELIAILSSGVSLYRVVLPILLLALFVSILAGFGGETIVPEANRKRMDIYRYDIRNEPREKRGTERQISLQDYDQRQVNIMYFDVAKKRANNVNIVWKEGTNVLERWDVKYMIWQDSLKAWQLHNITRRVFKDSLETVTRVDSALYEDTRILPEDLVELQLKPEEMNFSELNSFIKKMQSIGADARKWLVDLYMKISYPLANFIIVLFGAPLASQKRRSGPALGFALALLISFVYFLFLRSGQVLGHNGTLSPWLGAWIGNIVFFIGGLILMLRVRK